MAKLYSKHGMQVFAMLMLLCLQIYFITQLHGQLVEFVTSADSAHIALMFSPAMAIVWMSKRFIKDIE